MSGFVDTVAKYLRVLMALCFYAILILGALLVYEQTPLGIVLVIACVVLFVSKLSKIGDAYYRYNIRAVRQFLRDVKDPNF